MGFDFLTSPRFQGRIFTVVGLRSWRNGTRIALVNAVTTYCPDDDGCAWRQRSVRLKKHPKPAVVSSQSSMQLAVVEK
jgi:hypothetical protein